MSAQTLPVGGQGSGIAVRLVLAVVTAIFALVLLFAMAGGQAFLPPDGSGAVNTADIPAAYVPWVLRAGSMCAAISAAIIAAQDQVESGWNPDARNSGSGAEGIAQFIPSTFVSWGRDDDGTGNVSPLNPADEIMAQGRYDCSLAALASRLVASGQASGSVVDLALASYNAGPGQVEAARGVPADAAVYVHQIDFLAASKYSVVAVAGSAAGLTAVAAAESALGTPYQWGGSCSDPHGADPSAWCDCSSLVQMAWRVSCDPATWSSPQGRTGARRRPATSACTWVAARSSTRRRPGSLCSSRR